MTKMLTMTALLFISVKFFVVVYNRYGSNFLRGGVVFQIYNFFRGIYYKNRAIWNNLSVHPHACWEIPLPAKSVSRRHRYKVFLT